MHLMNVTALLLRRSWVAFHGRNARETDEARLDEGIDEGSTAMVERDAIGPADVDDAGEISALIVATLRASNAGDYPSEVIDRVAAGFDAEAVRGMIGRRRVLVARDGRRIVGTAALEGGAVRSVFVLPAAQGRGVGAALMAKILRLAERDGCASLRLNSSLTAVGFYARLGFVATGEALFRAGPGAGPPAGSGEERTVVMERGLRAPSTPAREM